MIGIFFLKNGSIFIGDAQPIPDDSPVQTLYKPCVLTNQDGKDVITEFFPGFTSKLPTVTIYSDSIIMFTYDLSDELLKLYTDWLGKMSG